MCQNSKFGQLSTEGFLYESHLKQYAFVHQMSPVGTSVMKLLVTVWAVPGATKTSGAIGPFSPSLSRPLLQLWAVLEQVKEKVTRLGQDTVWTLIYQVMGSHAVRMTMFDP